ncbi:hypothetical protein L2E82_48429 [Cichorium intybus]|uniref:Uncharacterized protein n=1 Tax=Cichorium intybus TaxID=13427 RepID=A0ACB8YZC7_CICIN|nr:hypothetical protein L2E82_48429 [Cichorium intybus]
MSSVNSPHSPASPISESVRMHLPNMERLTGLNCKEWLRNWRLHNSLVDVSKKIRDLMLLTIDPEFRKDFESMGPYELMQLVEERFQKPVEEERARIFKRLAECKLKEGSSINSHVLHIEAYIGELYKLGYSMSREKSVNILLASLTSEYDLFIQTYRKEDQKKTIMEMHPLLILYESLLDRHSSNCSATSGLSPVKRRNKKRSRSSGHVSNWESTKSDTVKERLEDAPNLLKAQGIKKARDFGA